MGKIGGNDLNDKQMAFCQEYIIDFNATQAGIRAGYSEKTAGATAHNLLKKAEIQAKIRELIDARSERTEVTADRVIQEFAKIAFSNIKDVMEWERTPKGYTKINVKQMGDVDGSLIAEMKNTENGIAVKLHDKMRALEALAKHTGVYDDRPQTTVNVKGYSKALWERAKAGDVWENFDNGGPDPEGDDDNGEG